MPAQIAKRLYNRFDIVAASPQPDGNVVLEATDSFTNASVRIFQWTPSAESLGSCEERLATFEPDAESETFSDGLSLYLALPAAVDSAPLLTRLRDQRLFMGQWPGIGEIVSPPPDAIEADPVVPPEVEPQPTGTRRGPWIAVAVVVAVIVGVWGIATYSQIQEERDRAAAAQRELDEAKSKAAEAEAQKQKLQEQLTKQEEARRLEEQKRQQEEADRRLAETKTDTPSESFAPVTSGPIQLPGGKISGSFFATMVRNNKLRDQKVLAFDGRDAALRYFSSDSDWKPGRMAMTSITTAVSETAGVSERVLVVLSEMAAQTQQSFSSENVFPMAWIKQRWSENFRLTTVSRVGDSWWVIMSKGSDLDRQVLLGPQNDWPDADIRKEREKDPSLFITDIAHREGQGFVVVLSTSTANRIRRQRWYTDWDKTQIEQNFRDGYHVVQSIQVRDHWYVVISDTGEDATWEIGDKLFPRDGVLRLSSQGFRIGWLW